MLKKGSVRKTCVCGATFYGASKHSGKYCKMCQALSKKRKKPVIMIKESK